MLNHLTCIFLIFMVSLCMSCSSGNEENKTIASTHPKLEEQLLNDSITMPVDDVNSKDLYHRYRITMEEYENDQNYTVNKMYTGQMARLDEGSHPDVGTFRSSIRDGLRDGINFAGKYTVVTVECGNNCNQHFVIDRQTGKITESIQSSLGAKFSKNSRILILNPPDSTVNYKQCTTCMPQAYVMEKNKLRKLSYEEDMQD